MTSAAPSVSSSNEVKKKPRTQQRSRTIARVGAVQILFQSEQSQQSPHTVLTEFITYRYLPKIPTKMLQPFEEGHIPHADLKLLKEIIATTSSQQAGIDKTLASLLPESWPMDRLDPVLRALLRAALGEMTTEIPTQVIINEYLDVAHGFFDGDEPKMTNAILDSFARNGRILLS